MDRKKIYEGKAKILFEDSDGNIIQHFKDIVTAFNNQVKEYVALKGALNNSISSCLMQIVSEYGIETHFIRKLNDYEQLVLPLSMIPIEFVVRNTAAGSIVKRLGIAEGTVFKNPIVELFLKDDDLGDPLINAEHAFMLGVLSEEEYILIRNILVKLNECLSNYFNSIKLKLIDFKVEFGRSKDGRIMLGDEISPDSCRIMDSVSGKKLDKDVFRLKIGDITQAYTEVARRMGV